MDRLDRLKSDFLATVSHELRTPLTAIQGMGLTLERSWDALDDDTRSSFLRSMNERAAALTALVEQLLDLSDLETARARLDAEPVDISALTDAAGGSVRERTPTTSTRAVGARPGCARWATPR